MEEGATRETTGVRAYIDDVYLRTLFFSSRGTSGRWDLVKTKMRVIQEPHVHSGCRHCLPAVALLGAEDQGSWEQ